MKSAQQALSNWTGSQARATSAYTAGVQAYSGDWAGATIAQQTALVTNFNTAVNNGSWARGVQSTGTQGWKSATEAKSANYGTGFSAGAGAFQTSITKIINAETNIVPSLPARGTYEQNKLRSTAFMDAMHALKGTLGA